jgi:hypothetical protein
MFMLNYQKIKIVIRFIIEISNQRIWKNWKRKSYNLITIIFLHTD